MSEKSKILQYNVEHFVQDSDNVLAKFPFFRMKFLQKNYSDV